jgi:hypothetical protein
MHANRHTQAQRAYSGCNQAHSGALTCELREIHEGQLQSGVIRRNQAQSPASSGRSMKANCSKMTSSSVRRVSSAGDGFGIVAAVA